jgi:hypothetical protein
MRLEPLISHSGILMTFYLSIILDLQNIYSSSTKSRRPGKTIYTKNVLETCVNGTMQDPSLCIDAELHQFINKL